MTLNKILELIKKYWMTSPPAKDFSIPNNIHVNIFNLCNALSQLLRMNLSNSIIKEFINMYFETLANNSMNADEQLKAIDKSINEILTRNEIIADKELASYFRCGNTSECYPLHAFNEIIKGLKYVLVLNWKEKPCVMRLTSDGKYMCDQYSSYWIRADMEKGFNGKAGIIIPITLTPSIIEAYCR